MIAVDTNILVYAHRQELPLHAAARQLVVQLAEGDELWAIPVFCLGELVRVISHPRLFDPPYTADEARQAVERILQSPSLQILHPGARYWRLFAEAVRQGNATGNLVFDAQIVAVCREWGVAALITEDRDFTRFPAFAIRTLAPAGK